MANMVSTVVAIIIGMILIVGVAVPITIDVINNQAFTGTNALIANNIPVFLLIGALVLATAFFGFSGFGGGGRRRR